MEQVDTVIVGAGVIGLAIARELAPSRSVVLLEQERHFGEHLSSRNSEVIHAGLYYPPDSLKARLCLRECPAGSYHRRRPADKKCY